MSDHETMKQNSCSSSQAVQNEECAVLQFWVAMKTLKTDIYSKQVIGCLDAREGRRT